LKNPIKKCTNCGELKPVSQKGRMEGLCSRCAQNKYRREAYRKTHSITKDNTLSNKDSLSTEPKITPREQEMLRITRECKAVKNKAINFPEVFQYLSEVKRAVEVLTYLIDSKTQSDCNAIGGVLNAMVIQQDHMLEGTIGTEEEIKMFESWKQFTLVKREIKELLAMASLVGSKKSDISVPLNNLKIQLQSFQKRYRDVENNSYNGSKAIANNKVYKIPTNPIAPAKQYLVTFHKGTKDQIVRKEWGTNAIEAKKSAIANVAKYNRNVPPFGDSDIQVEAIK